MFHDILCSFTAFPPCRMFIVDSELIHADIKIDRRS